MKLSTQILGIIALLGIICSIGLSRKCIKLNEEISITANNQKILLGMRDSLNTSNRVLKLTIDQLNYFNDSILNEMNKVRKELKIKDSKLKSLSYINSVIEKRDTIIFNDTIFIENIKIDTVIEDRWYSMKLNLEYPNRIITEPSFISEKYIVVSRKKETINPPKKFFISRWFQRKHWVMEVNVKEKNPYIKESNNRFIEFYK